MIKLTDIQSDACDIVDKNKIMGALFGSIHVASLSCLLLVMLVFWLNENTVPRIVYGYVVVLASMLLSARVIDKKHKMEKVGCSESRFADIMSAASERPVIISAERRKPPVDDIDKFLEMAL